MYIHREEFRTIKESIQASYPDYAITFDVVFESQGDGVAYHTDFESLGPFIVADVMGAVRARDFITLHTNLTPTTSHLTTLEWPLLSWSHSLVNRAFNIFSMPHRVLAWITQRQANYFQTVHPNHVGHFNAFNNLALHSVTAGDARVSYAIRLVHKRIQTSLPTVWKATRRSKSCEAFATFAPLFEGDAPLSVASVRWEDVTPPPPARSDEELESETCADAPRCHSPPSPSVS